MRSVLEDFRRLSFPHLAQHKVRTVLTALGVALGVATIIGLRMSFQPLAGAFKLALDRMAGRATFQISNAGNGNVPEELLDEVRKLAGVQTAAASLTQFAPILDTKGERVLILGVDLLADQQVRDYRFTFPPGGGNSTEIQDPLVFMAKADSVAIGDELLRHLGLKVGDKIDVRLPYGEARLTIRGVLDSHRGPASVFGGRVALMDIFAAQRLLHLQRRFSSIDVVLNSNVRSEEVEPALRSLVAGRAQVDRAQTQVANFEHMTHTFEVQLETAAGISTVLGLYLIFNTMTIAVAQRRRDFGILRSLGMCRRGVIHLVMTESILVGLLGAGIGIPLGVAMAKVFAPGVLAVYNNGAAPLDSPAATLTLSLALQAAGTGILTALCAALIPAWQAVRIHPLEAVRPPAVATATTRIYWAAATAGCVLLVISNAPLLVSSRALAPLAGDLDTADHWLVFLSGSGVFMGITLIAPLIILLLCGRSEPVADTVLGATGTISSRSLEANMKRVVLTGTAFVASIGMAVLLASIHNSFHADILTRLRQFMGGHDLIVSSGNILSGGRIQLPSSLVGEIAHLPGVSRVDALRFMGVTYEGQWTRVIAMDFTSGTQSLDLVGRDGRDVSRELGEGKGVVVDVDFARHHGLRQGDVITLPAPGGELRAPILALAISMRLQEQTIYIDRGLYHRHWLDDTVDLIEPDLKPGADRASVMNAIRANWGDRYGVFVSSVAEYRREGEIVLQRALMLLVPIMAIAIAIASLGLVNALSASVLDRVHEIGTLRAVGATRAQIASMVTLESAILGFVGAALGIPAGIIWGYHNALSGRIVAEQTVTFTGPTPGLTISIFVASILLAALGGYFPGRTASRIVAADALQSE